MLDRTRPGGDVVDVTPEAGATGIASVDVTFTEPIDASSFDYRDITLTRNGARPDTLTTT